MKSRIQVTSLWKWAARDEPGYVQTVQAEEIIQPLLYGVSGSVPDGLVKRHFVERSSCAWTVVDQQSEDRDTHTHTHTQ